VGDIAVMDSAERAQFQPEGERRQFKRFPMQLVVHAQRDDLIDADAPSPDSRPEQNVTLEVENFSLGGMRGFSPTAMRRDERVTVVMPPFGTRPQLNVTGWVVRCERLESRFDVGIEFGQTRDEPESSPWVRIPDLFYMAGESSGGHS
jgi:PilZ domain